MHASLVPEQYSRWRQVSGNGRKGQYVIVCEANSRTVKIRYEQDGKTRPVDTANWDLHFVQEHDDIQDD